MHLEQLKGLLDQITQVVSFSLAVVNFVAKVCIFCLEKVHDGENLSIVGHQSLSDGVRAGHECLQDLQGNADNLWVSRVQGSLNWDNKLGDDGEHFGTALLEHIEYTLHGQKSVGIHFLSDALEEYWQVMMVVQLLDLDLPIDLVLWAMLDRNGQISTVVEEAEFTDGDLPPVDSSSPGLLLHRFGSWHVEAGALASETISLLEDSSAGGGDGDLHLVDWLNYRDAESSSCLQEVFWEVTECGVLGSW